VQLVISFESFFYLQKL